jgi:hypothetical protein
MVCQSRDCRCGHGPTSSSADRRLRNLKLGREASQSIYSAYLSLLEWLLSDFSRYLAQNCGDNLPSVPLSIAINMSGNKRNAPPISIGKKINSVKKSRLRHSSRGHSGGSAVKARVGGVRLPLRAKKPSACTSRGRPRRRGGPAQLSSTPGSSPQYLRRVPVSDRRGRSGDR